ncbi:MAG TPA: crosslink repair DNA glycosylase YcaQ family protein [Frankiaceae bacterium]|nr:crosslink repair DNA glycosylase YcaQ family protein [Frankiaceae bacterium]
MDTLTAAEARRLAVRAQGLSGPAAARRAGGVPGLLRRLGAVQLDTISVLARSHELVPYARLGPVGRPAVEAAYWAAPPVAFEYWSHAASVVPLEAWPLYAFRRRHYRERYEWHRKGTAGARAEVLAALRDRGPLTATDLGGAKRGGVWWDWSDIKVAAEELLAWGEVVVTRRERWRRVYDLPERAVPPDLLGHDPPDEECHVELVRQAGARLGVATVGDLADYFRLPVAATAAAVAPAGLVPVTVAGWGQQAYADPDALAALAAGSVPGASRTVLLSPFDSLVWTRERTERVFGMRHRLEAYTPKAKREYGYFAMPVLAGGRLVARVDPTRSGRTLVARQVTFDPRETAVRAVATALREAASWVGCDAVAVERVGPPDLAAPLAAALR